MTALAHDRQETAFGSDSVSASQIKAIFAAARRVGLGTDEVRALTPAGSVKALSRLQASNLLDRLNPKSEFQHPRKSPRGPRRPKGVYRIATAAQLAKIDALRIDLGWTSEGLTGWLSERHHRDGRQMTLIQSSIDAQAVIELLKGVLSRTRQELNKGANAGHLELCGTPFEAPPN